jgi:hypothetical protein
LTQENNAVDQSLTTISGPLGLRKLIGDNATVVFVQWLEMKNKYAIDSCAPKVIFDKNPMFQFDKSDDFNKNLLNTSNAVLINVNKSITPNPYNEADLQTLLNKNNKDINDVQKVEVQTPKPPETNTTTTTPPATTPATPTVPTPTPNRNTVPVNNTGGQPSESYRFKNSDKLYEEADPIAASQPNPSGNPANITPTNVNTTATPATPPATTPATPTTTPAATPAENPLDKLKPAIKKYIADNFYGYSSNKIKTIKAPAKIGAEDAMLALAKGSKATNLHQNLAKLLNSIVNLKDKNTLLRVRAALAGDPDLKKSADDLKNEIPL